MTIAKSITKTLDISVEDVRIDLTATIRSYDLTDTQFIFEIKSSNGMTVNLTGSTAMYIVEYVHNSQTYAIQGDVNIIGTDTLSFNLPEDLKGYSGTVLIGIYVKLTDGTKIDIKDIAVRIEPSIMDKDIDFSAKTYFKDFETVKAEVILEGEKAKTSIKAVLPSVQAEISEIKTEIENLPDIPDLFVAYADNINGDRFSKTDTTKLYKGYGVKNSNLPADYRWERNVDSLQVGGRNLLKDTANFGNDGRPSGAKDGWLLYSQSTIESEKYNGLTVRSLKNVSSSKTMCDYYFTGFNLGDTYTFSFWAKGTIDRFRCYFYGDVGFVGVVNVTASNGTKNNRHDGGCDFNNNDISENEWKRIWITWKLANTGDINVAKKVLISTDGATGGDLHICGAKLEKGNQATDWSPAPEDMLLNSNPINSILTTLSAENPSTTLGGIWTQLGTETKFSNTIYYWKRTN